MSRILNHTSRTIGALTLGLIALCTLSIPTSARAAAPEPSPVSIAWEFTFDAGPLRLAYVEHNGETRPYFYLTFRVTNFTDQDLLLAPDVTLVSDGVETYRSGRDIPAGVTEEILRRLDNPLIESQIDIVSTVLSGKEHARDGVVIWPAQDLDADEITVYFSGLSGEFESYVVGRDTANPQRYTLRKTLMLRYATPGDFENQGARPFELVEKRWVMR
jgi:hypothetical protein